MLKKWKILIVSALILASTQSAHALRAVGPINPVNGFPLWFQDEAGVAVSLCVNDPNCLPGDPPIVGNAFSQQIGFGSEAFYFASDASVAYPGGNALLVLALEAAFLNGDAAPNDQIVFTRVRIVADVPVIGTYTVTHPYGVETFNVDAIVPGPEIKFTRDILGLRVDNFAGTVASPDVRVFLKHLTPPPGYVGGALLAAPVTGSPVGTNLFRIQGPAGSGVDATTTDFTASGKIVGMSATVAPPAVPGSFGPVMLGASALQTVTITNLAGVPLTLPAAFTPTGPDAADFTAAAPAAGVSCLGATLTAAAPGNTCDFNLVFAPTGGTVAARNATLAIAAAGSPDAVIQMSGTAQQAVTVIQGTNGTITPAGDAISGILGVNLGTDQTFTFTPNAGFVLLDAKVDNISVRAQVVNNTFTLANVTATHTLTASFIRRGDLTGDGVVTVDDANRAMEIVTGLGAAPTAEEIASLDVAPMVNSQPSSDGTLDIGDVIMIMRRANNLGPAW